ncbi:hypothetical protein [Actinomadura sp. HBU206391]|uniref:hypothetical protein n=1 Tax=Actinomadura sp. HBU206391 TaxID=2731692 RepID=UPI00164F17C9|nr:hypothetical protein [Actinomadura sp. HBU206391]MBC6461724.1 hypothetical protein [Actinomadura sp. HBU206391]
MTTRDPDRLIELLPAYLRKRDIEAGEPLRALLAVIAEQADLVEADVQRLYDNWFIETCDDWAVPYIGDLVGYRMLSGYEEALSARTPGGAAAAGSLAARLAPRRDVADTVASRRRKGTLALLEEIAATVAEWPARAVEFHRLLARTQPVRLYGGDATAVRNRATAAGPLGYADVRRGADLDLLDGPFDPFGHGAQPSRITAAPARRQGRYGPPAVGVFVWRLKPYSVTRAPAFCIDRARNLFTFSVLGNDTPLVTRPVPEPSPTHIATAENVPGFIRRRALRDHLADFYGPGKSLTIWRRDGDDGDGDGDDHGGHHGGHRVRPVPLADLVVADLSGWAYRPRRGQVVIDPVLGRIAFGARSAPKGGVWVTYHHAFSDDMGGGEYPRPLSGASSATRTYRVGPGEDFERIEHAYERWREDGEPGARPPGIIEITHSGSYQEQLEFVVDPGDRLELRAADGARPVLRLLDWNSNRPDSLHIRASDETPRHDGEHDDALPPARVVLDGVVITGRGVSVTGPLGSLAIRHSTLVPGWTLEPDCAPTRPEEPSLVLEDTSACVEIERSVLGTIVVLGDEVRTDPLPIHIADSVLDATGPERAALSAPDCRHAHAVLHVHRTTVIGEVHTHAIEIGEDTVFDGRVHVARRGVGCLRFCWVPPGSRTPRRYHCQPDLAWASLRERAEADDLDLADLPRLRDLEARRVEPRFTSRNYGTPAYVQLATGTAAEITRGAEDGSEMGAWHDLFQPQREDNLRARLAEFSPAGTDAGIVHVT